MMEPLTTTIAAASETSSVLWWKCKQVAGTAVRDAKYLYVVLKHPGTPWRARLVLFLPVAYICSPIQLLPSFIPVIGQLDDLAAIWIANWILKRLVSEEVQRECRETVSSLPSLRQLIATRWMRNPPQPASKPSLKVEDYRNFFQTAEWRVSDDEHA